MAAPLTRGEPPPPAETRRAARPHTESIAFRRTPPARACPCLGCGRPNERGAAGRTSAQSAKWHSPRVPLGTHGAGPLDLLIVRSVVSACLGGLQQRGIGTPAHPAKWHSLRVPLGRGLRQRQENDDGAPRAPRRRAGGELRAQAKRTRPGLA